MKVQLIITNCLTTKNPRAFDKRWELASQLVEVEANVDRQHGVVFELGALWEKFPMSRRLVHYMQTGNRRRWIVNGK